MYILVCASTPGEVRPTMDFISHQEPDVEAGEIEVVITGIGLVATTYALTQHIYRHRPSLVIQAGIAGCFLPHKKAEVFAVKEDVAADLGVAEAGGFKTIFDLGLAQKNDPPFREGLLVNPYEKLLSHSGLKPVRGISVNSISTHKKTINWYQQYFSPVVESMEGAALHYVCLTEKVPFLQVRAVSNEVGQRDKTKWDMKGSIQHLNEVLIKLLIQLKKDDDTYYRI
jgi:futalosine hydrolase